MALFDSLAKALAESRTDFVAMDLQGIERRIAEQEQLCGQITSLDAEITRAQMRCVEQTGTRAQTSAIARPGELYDADSSEERIRATLGRVAEAQAKVKKLNDAHQAMLRRSRRTVNTLLNFFNSYATTYGTPAPSVTGTLHEERV